MMDDAIEEETECERCGSTSVVNCECPHCGDDHMHACPDCTEDEE